MITIVSLTTFLGASTLLMAGFRPYRFAEIIQKIGLTFLIVGAALLSVETYQVIAAQLQTLPEGAIQGVSQASRLTPAHFATLFATGLAWVSLLVLVVWNMRLVGVITAPLVSLTLMIQVFFLNGMVRESSGIDYSFLGFHIFTAIIGQAFAVVACAAALMLLWQQKKLKAKEIADLPSNFPALNTLSTSLRRSLWVGFGFISLSLITGAMIALKHDNLSSPSSDAKALWAIMVWAWYLTILVLKSILGYRDQQIARLSLIGLALLATSWFGLAFSGGWGQ